MNALAVLTAVGILSLEYCLQGIIGNELEHKTKNSKNVKQKRHYIFLCDITEKRFHYWRQ